MVDATLGQPLDDLAIIIPAYNEAAGLAATIESLLGQTVSADRIIVVDDCSTDETRAIALSYSASGVETWTTPVNLGSKAKAQNYALQFIDNAFVLPLDGDTVLAPDYIARIAPAFEDPDVAVASGCVLTQRQTTVWEKARQLEYLFGFHLYRTIQQRTNSVTVCSGCCSVFRTEFLSEGGFPETTLTEDIFYTWQQHLAGRRAVYVHDAVAYAAEPATYEFMNKQLKRWKCGWFHGVRLQFVQMVRRKPMVALWAGIQLLETALAPLLVLLAIYWSATWDLQWYEVCWLWMWGDLIAFWPAVIYGCVKRGYPIRRAVASYHAWWLLKLVNLRWDMTMLVRELVLVPLGVCAPFTTYERGKA